MKVTGIRSVLYGYELARPIGDVHLAEGARHGVELAVFVDTDEPGLTGETIGPPAAADMIDRLAPLVVGEDPRAVKAIWQRLMDVAFKAGNAGAIKVAIASIDCALWDLRAKAHGVPLYLELGASSGEVPAYASGLDTPLDDDELAAFYGRMATEAGIHAGKLKVGRDREADLRRLDIMSSALARSGRKPGLIVDANEFWSVKQAVQRVREMEAQHELVWVEEPVRRWDVDGLRRVSDAISAPVATGENLDDVHDYVPLVRGGGVDLVQIGFHTTGITGALQVAELADAFDLPVALMNCPARFTAHMAAALPHHTMMEVFDMGRAPAVVEVPPIRDGKIMLSSEPGSGVRFDLERLERLAVTELPEGTLATLYRRAPDSGKVG